MIWRLMEAEILILIPGHLSQLYQWASLSRLLYGIPLIVGIIPILDTIPNTDIVW